MRPLAIVLIIIMMMMMMMKLISNAFILHFQDISHGGIGVQGGVTRITAAVASPLTGLATTLPLNIASEIVTAEKINDDCNAW